MNIKKYILCCRSVSLGAKNKNYVSLRFLWDVHILIRKSRCFSDYKLLSDVSSNEIIWHHTSVFFFLGSNVNGKAIIICLGESSPEQGDNFKNSL